MNISYKEKYLKYKSKYLKLKKQLDGGYIPYKRDKIKLLYKKIIEIEKRENTQYIIRFKPVELTQTEIEQLILLQNILKSENLYNEEAIFNEIKEYVTDINWDENIKFNEAQYKEFYRILFSIKSTIPIQHSKPKIDKSELEKLYSYRKIIATIIDKTNKYIEQKNHNLITPIINEYDINDLNFNFKELNLTKEEIESIIDLQNYLIGRLDLDLEYKQKKNHKLIMIKIQGIIENTELIKDTIKINQIYVNGLPIIMGIVINYIIKLIEKIHYILIIFPIVEGLTNISPIIKIIYDFLKIYNEPEKYLTTEPTESHSDIYKRKQLEHIKKISEIFVLTIKRKLDEESLNNILEMIYKLYYKIKRGLIITEFNDIEKITDIKISEKIFETFLDNVIYFIQDRYGILPVL